MRTHSISVVLFAVAVAAHADGFLYNGQSARGLGVMNACIAQADDPSVVFFNPGGLALMPKKTSFAIGGTLGGNLNGHFRGRPPGIADGAAGEERAASDAAPHAYVTAPLGERFTVGAGTYSLFRMHTEWSNPEQFVGRFIATKSSVESTDVTGAAGFQVTPRLGLGAGVVYRTADLSAARIAGALSNDRQSSTGWSAGVLYRPLAHWSLALTHRNEIGVFPAQTNGGVAWRPADSFVFEIDVNRTSWSRVRELVIGDVRFPLNLKDTSTLRAGFRNRISPRTEWHLGYAAERAAQPDETVGPFMHDAQRSTYGAGIVYRGVDVAFSWSTDELREIDTNIDQINGNYRRNKWLLAVTVTR